MYLQDYDEGFPMSAYLNGTCVATFYWEVVPYVKNDQITLCPSEPKAIQLTAAVGAPCQNTPPFTSYVTNSAVFLNGFVPTQLRQRRWAVTPFMGATVSFEPG